MLTIYTATWCGDCARTKVFLRHRRIPFHEINVEADPAAMAIVLRLNGGYQSVPMLVLSDGSTMSEPTNRELTVKLGIAA
jgi:mycoredoxin